CATSVATGFFDLW
nr:immunoglobulin heavy chain junction region [Macaca mulatta]MOY21206.1 immunoglobulin heavy chain junction region [Macaca mulatta]MOY21381.1 immunoglobulin heavy chain junction region [Macaca mulatta]MOY21807.1 immunoglobulin heavy chain junction region [Macaca mulatta]MOY22199.1 immunoglobulin heavy chain junction region [Macaca mulatta]